MNHLAGTKVEKLTHQRCAACEGGEPPLRPDEIAKLQPEVPDWQVSTIDGHPSLGKTFHFKNFAQSIDFVNKVRDIAEGEGHHPDVMIHWDTVRLENWTHATGGLHKNDFILAAKINQIVAS